MSFSSVMQVTFHGHKGFDLDAETDVTGFVHSLTFTHAVRAPWETITVGMQLPAQAWQRILAGVARDDGRVPKPGFWVVVWLFPSNKDGTATKAGGRTAIAWGYVEKVVTGITHHDNGQQTTMPIHVSCISWLGLLGKSALSLAAPQSGVGREGFVYNVDTWNDALMTVLNTTVNQNPGEALQTLFHETVRLYFPTTLTGSEVRDFGQDIPVVWNAEKAATFAPTRAATVQAVQGQAIHSAAHAIPGKQSLLAWLNAIFVSDLNMIEMFSSLEYPQQGDDGSVSSATPAARALGGAQPVLVYRLRPFNLTAINGEALKAADKKDGYGANTEYGQTASEKAGLYQTPVRPADHGFGDPFYEIPAEELMAVEGLTWDDNDRVNLAFVNSIFGDLGPIKAYDEITAPVVQDLSEFNRYGQRAFELSWPFVPPVQGQATPANQSSENLRTALDATGELAWTFVGGGEQTCSGRLKTLFTPWRRAGHWFSVELKLQQGDDDTRLAFLTGYIEHVTHSARIVNPDTGHTEMDTIVHFTRGRLSNRPKEFFWTAAGIETRIKRTTPADNRGFLDNLGSSVPAQNIREAVNRIKNGSLWMENIPTIPLASGMRFLMSPGVAASTVLDTPEKRKEAVAKLQEAAAALRQQAVAPPRGAPTPKFRAFPSSLSGNKQKANQPSALRIFTLDAIPFPSSSYSSRGTNIIKALVIHHTNTDGRNSKGTVAALKNASTSTHFLVESDGTVFMLLNPDLWIAKQAGRSVLNRQSIGIDFAGRLHLSKNKMPKEQYLAGRLLIDYLLRRYGLPPFVVSKKLRATNYYSPAEKKLLPGKNPVDPQALLDSQFTVFRHYNVKATACPGKTPVEALATPVDWQYEVLFEAAKK